MELLFRLNSARLQGLSTEHKIELKGRITKIQGIASKREKQLRFAKVRNFFTKFFNLIRFGKAKTTSEWASYLNRKLSFEKDPEIIFSKGKLSAKAQGRFVMPVLEQHFDGTGQGSSTCGLHVAKNGLLVLGAIHKGKVPEKGKMFKNRKLFKTLFFGIKGKEKGWKEAANLTKNGDAAVAQIWKIIEGVREGSCIAPENSTAAAMKALEKEQEGVPCFSAASIAFSPDTTIYGGGGAYELRTLSALHQMRQAAKSNKSFVHSFSLGVTEMNSRGALKKSLFGSGHWVSCTLIQGKDGNRSWIGCNSVLDRYPPMKKSIEYLEGRLDESDTEFLQQARERYHEAAGFTLERRANWLTAKEGSLDLNDRAALLKEKEDNLAIIDAAHTFMKDVGWLERSPLVCKKEIENLQKITAFYGSLKGGEKYKEMATKLTLILEADLLD